MRAIVRATLLWAAIASVVTGCVRHRDLDLGNNRYMVSMQGNQYRGIGAVEQSFYQHAQEVATAHGFDSFRVLDIRSGFEPTPTGFQPFTKGTIQLYNGPKVGADGKPVRPAGGMSTGTAFAVNPDGVLLTNAHVAQECREITLRRFDGTIIPASLLAADRTNDLALVKTTSPTPEFAQFRGSPDIRQGDTVIAVGFPLSDLLSSGTSTTLTTGTVSALSGLQNDTRVLQVSAPVQPGNSGGPLLDQGGDVIAIVSSGMNRVGLAVKEGIIPENINFAIKGSVARAFMDAAGVTYRVAPSTRPMSTVEIGEQARRFTHFVTCKT